MERFQFRDFLTLKVVFGFQPWLPREPAVLPRQIVAIALQDRITGRRSGPVARPPSAADRCARDIPHPVIVVFLNLVAMSLQHGFDIVAFEDET
jgi:hypothetical protein